MNNQEPKNWPRLAPPYFSKQGWEFEKELTRQKLLFKSKDSSAAAITQKAGELADAAISLKSEAMFFKYQSIVLWLLAYRMRLLSRYPLAR